MAREDMLRRVEDDLRLGRTHLAINRLTMAVKSLPSDLDLRSRLAALHRQTGNWAEAGRWGYFDEPVDERSRQAFDKAWRDPRAQRDALRWTRADDDPHVVRARLDRLEANLPARAPATAVDEADGYVGFGTAVGCLVAGVLVALLLVVVGVGLLTVVRWVF